MEKESSVERDIDENDVLDAYNEDNDLEEEICAATQSFQITDDAFPSTSCVLRS